MCSQMILRYGVAGKKRTSEAGALTVWDDDVGEFSETASGAEDKSDGDFYDDEDVLIFIKGATSFQFFRSAHTIIVQVYGLSRAGAW